MCGIEETIQSALNSLNNICIRSLLILQCTGTFSSRPFVDIANINWLMIAETIENVLIQTESFLYFRKLVIVKVVDDDGCVYYDDNENHYFYLLLS